MNRRLVRVREFCQQTGIPEGTLRHYRATGVETPFWLLGGRLVAYEDECAAWLEAMRAADGKLAKASVA